MTVKALTDNTDGHAKYCRADASGDEHYANVRRCLSRWYAYLISRKHLSPGEGALAICAPGFGVAQRRDLSCEIIHRWITQHPRVIVADLSFDILADAIESFDACAGPLVQNRFDFLRCDFSHGLSTQFDTYLRPLIDGIREPDHLLHFAERISSQTDLVDIRRTRTSSDDLQRCSPRMQLGNPRNFWDFGRFVPDEQPVRFVIANLLLAGMIAPTEQHFRDKLMSFCPDRGSRHALPEDASIHVLQQWHNLVTRVNNELAVSLFEMAYDANPGVCMFLVTETNALYDRFGLFPRIDLREVQRRIEPRGIRLHHMDQWVSSHHTETPPHTHHMVAVRVEQDAVSDHS